MMNNQIDKRTKYQYVCEVGSKLLPAKDLTECIFIAKMNGPCAVFELDKRQWAEGYTYLTDIFVDEVLAKEVKNNGISQKS